MFSLFIPKCHCENVTRDYVIIPGEFWLWYQDILSSTWNLNFVVPQVSVKGLLFFSLIIFFPKWFHPLLGLYIIYMSSTLKFTSHTQITALIFKHTHTPLPTQNSHFNCRYLEHSTPTIKPSAAPPSYNFFFPSLFLLHKWNQNPSRCSTQKSGSHSGFISLYTISDSIH